MEDDISEIDDETTAPDGSEEDGNTEGGEGDEGGDAENSIAPGFPIPPSCSKSNVVATQSWVFHVLRKFWNWTRFFATQSIRVAGGMYARKIKTGELEGDEIYAKRLVLLDPKGKPTVVYIDEEGNLKHEYKFEDLFIFGDSEVELKRYAYRYPEISANFIGVTPMETLLNFIPFQSEEAKEFNGVMCPKIGEADGAEELIKETLLLKCPETKKITGLKIVDADGNPIRTLDFEPPEGVNVRRLTINMPSFKPPEGEEGEPCRVVLPGDIMDGYGRFKPFVPPFLKPPYPPPPHLFPPTPPVVPPHIKPVPPKLSPDLFDDKSLDDLDDGSDLFGDDYAGLGNEEETPNNPLYVEPGF